MLLQILEIIFEVQRKRSVEKNNKKRNKLSILQNTFFSFFFLFGPILLSNLITFLFFIHFNWFKVLQDHHLKFYKSSFNSNRNRSTYKEFFGCSKTSFVEFNGLFFWVFDPFILGGHNFFNSFFFMIFNVPNAPTWGIPVLFGHQKKWNPSLGFGLSK
jgi:hypothetical protein